MSISQESEAITGGAKGQVRRHQRARAHRTYRLAALLHLECRGMKPRRRLPRRMEHVAATLKLLTISGMSMPDDFRDGYGLYKSMNGATHLYGVINGDIVPLVLPDGFEDMELSYSHVET
jgi:hypothetical protein